MQRNREPLLLGKSLEVGSVGLPKRRLETQTEPGPLGVHWPYCYLPASDFPVIPRCGFGGLKVMAVS